MVKVCWLWIAGLCCVVASPARATLLVYEPTSASPPGLSISASITVNGGLSDLPTVDQSSTPIDFGNLLAFDLLAPDGATYTLANFVAPPVNFNLPMWSISPGGISFFDITDDFIISFASGTIHFDTDAPGDCFLTGTCFTTGNWKVVPEPSSITLILAGLLALSFWKSRARIRPERRVLSAGRADHLIPPAMFLITIKPALAHPSSLMFH